MTLAFSRALVTHVPEALSESGLRMATATPVRRTASGR
jgi:hypothetical protein